MAFFSRGLAKARLDDFRGSTADLKIYLQKLEGFRLDDEKRIYTLYEGPAYWIIGLNYIKIGDKESGCLHLSTAGEKGSDVYNDIRKFCH